MPIFEMSLFSGLTTAINTSIATSCFMFSVAADLVAGPIPDSLAALYGCF